MRGQSWRGVNCNCATIEAKSPGQSLRKGLGQGKRREIWGNENVTGYLCFAFGLLFRIQETRALALGLLCLDELLRFLGRGQRMEACKQHCMMRNGTGSTSSKISITNAKIQTYSNCNTGVGFEGNTP